MAANPATGFSMSGIILDLSAIRQRRLIELANEERLQRLAKADERERKRLSRLLDGFTDDDPTPPWAA